jgi:hypothetical protein
MRTIIQKNNNKKESQIKSSTKDKWSTPKLTELGINNTLGGHIEGTSESYTGTGS